MSPLRNFYHAQLTAAAIASVDSYTVLLAHFDGTADSKVFTDSSTYGKTMTGNGSAHLSATQSKFGGTSVYLKGSNGTVNVLGSREVISLSDSADWYMGTGSFTIDWWHYSGITTTQMTFGQYTNSTNWWGVFSYPAPNTSNQVLGLGALTAGAWDINISATSSTTESPINTWNHYAVVRIDNGNAASSWRLYINGISKTVSLNVGAFSGAIGDYSGTAYIGTLLGNFQLDLNGYVDELRISKGIARWTAATFSVPTSPY